MKNNKVENKLENTRPMLKKILYTALSFGLYIVGGSSMVLAAALGFSEAINPLQMFGCMTLSAVPMAIGCLVDRIYEEKTQVDSNEKAAAKILPKQEDSLLQDHESENDYLN